MHLDLTTDELRALQELLTYLRERGLLLKQTIPILDRIDTLLEDL